jgi:hypothetical protein
MLFRIDVIEIDDEHLTCVQKVRRLFIIVTSRIESTKNRNST